MACKMITRNDLREERLLYSDRYNTHRLPNARSDKDWKLFMII